MSSFPLLLLLFCVDKLHVCQVENCRSLWPIYLSTPIHSSDDRGQPTLYAYILLGYLLQPDKIHGDVSESTQTSTINKDVFQELMNALFDDEFRASNQKCVYGDRPHSSRLHVLTTSFTGIMIEESHLGCRVGVCIMRARTYFCTLVTCRN